MVKLIWAQDINGGIGLKNKLPWKIKDEMAHFKAATNGKTVVMGWKTYQSIGRPLPNRTNIVMSRSQSLIPGVKVYTDINKLINDFKSEDIYIIGGASLYNEFMSYADELIISKINKSYNCDVFMKCDFSKWNIAKLDESHPEFSITWYTSKK